MIDNKNLSRIGLGTSRICSLGSRVSKEQAYKLLQTAAQNGVYCIDTANSYGSGDAEIMLGKILKECNYRFHLTTKAGYQICEVPSWCSPMNQIGKKLKHFFFAKQCFHPDFIISSLQKSLFRLQVPFVDIFFLHDPPPEVLDDTSLLAAMQDAQRAGFFLKMGVSIKRRFLSMFLKPHFFTSFIQTQINPWQELPDFHPSCTILGNEVFGSLHFKILESYIKKIAIHENLTPRQLLMAFALRFPAVKTVYLGTRNPAHLQEVVAISNYKLSESAIIDLIKLKELVIHDI